MRKWIVLWFVSLVVVAALTSVLTRAQTVQGQLPVFSGPDLGFRMEGINRSGEPTGTFVVRVKGEWVPVGFTPNVRPLH